MDFFWVDENFVSLELFKKKWAFYLNVNPVKKIYENPNFLATRFVRLVLAGPTDLGFMYTAPSIMLLMRANPLREQVGGRWALAIETFWALWKSIEPLGGCQLGPAKVGGGVAWAGGGGGGQRSDKSNPIGEPPKRALSCKSTMTPLQTERLFWDGNHKE